MREEEVKPAAGGVEERNEGSAVNEVGVERGGKGGEEARQLPKLSQAEVEA